MNVKIDIHTHIPKENEEVYGILREHNMKAIVCGTTPKEVNYLLGRTKDMDNIIVSGGIHPFVADEFKVEEIETYFKQVKIVGEIGMDSVWCKVPLRIQEEIFVKQLELAAQYNKPVILHTKGEEKRIAHIIERYPQKKLVHWYSCMEHLELYIKQDCYFSVGPDILKNKAVMNVCSQVDIKRLFVETDGLDGVIWGLGRMVEAKEIPTILDNTMKRISLIKNIPLSEVKKIMENNYYEYLQT